LFYEKTFRIWEKDQLKNQAVRLSNLLQKETDPGRAGVEVAESKAAIVVRSNLRRSINPEADDSMAPMNIDTTGHPKFLHKLQAKCVEVYSMASQMHKEYGSPEKWNKYGVDEVDFLVAMQQSILTDFSPQDQLVFSHIYAR